MSTLFLPTVADMLINVDHIDGIKVGDNGVCAAYVHGEVHHLRIDIDDVRRMLQPLIPAASGFTLLRCSFDDKSSLVYRAPIVAWRYDGRRAVPITPDVFVVDLDDDDNAAVLCSDGLVCRLDGVGGDYANEADWLKDAEHWHKQLKKETEEEAE
jgi:hypothetical protein